MVRRAGCMMQQLLYCDLTVNGKLRDMLHNFVVERQLSLPGQQHDARGGELLRHRGERKRRVIGQRSDPGNVRKSIMRFETDASAFGDEHGSVEYVACME